MAFLYSKLRSTLKWKQQIEKNIADQKYNVPAEYIYIYRKRETEFGEQKIQYP